jgi:hypothetical protein
MNNFIQLVDEFSAYIIWGFLALNLILVVILWTQNLRLNKYVNELKERNLDEAIKTKRHFGSSINRIVEQHMEERLYLKNELSKAVKQHTYYEGQIKRLEQDIRNIKSEYREMALEKTIEMGKDLLLSRRWFQNEDSITEVAGEIYKYLIGKKS